MSKIKIDKVVSSLPGTLVANTVYAVRVGSGFDLYISNSTGTVAHPINMRFVTSSVGNIVKNTAYAISSTTKIISVNVFNPTNGKTYVPQLNLAGNRLSGSFKLPYNISNAEIDIISL